MVRVSVLSVLLLVGPAAWAEEALPLVGLPAPAAESPLSTSHRLLYEADDTRENLEAALVAYDQALETGLSPSETASAYADKALALLRLGDLQTTKEEKQAYYDRGKAEAEKGIAADPTSARAHFMRTANLGSWARERGIFQSLFLLDDIRAGFEKALEIDPDYNDALMSLAMMDSQVPRLAGGSKKRAEKRFRAVLEADPHFTRASLEYAEFVAKRGREEQSIEIVKGVLAEDQPSHPGDYRKFDRPRAQALLKELSE